MPQFLSGSVGTCLYTVQTGCTSSRSSSHSCPSEVKSFSLNTAMESCAVFLNKSGPVSYHKVFFLFDCLYHIFWQHYGSVVSSVVSKQEGLEFSPWFRPGVFLFAVCMFSCLCGFSPGTQGSSHRPKIYNRLPPGLPWKRSVSLMGFAWLYCIKVK